MKRYIRIAWTNLKHRRIRSWLTIIGIFIGIAAVVSLISVGSGLQKSVNEQFEKLGTDKILISPKGGFFGIGSQGIKLSERDLEAVKKVGGIELAGGVIYKVARLKREKETEYTWIMGIPLDESHDIITDMQSLKISKGRDLKNGDKYKVVVGSRLAEKNGLFSKAVSVGSNIYIEEEKFEVVGILEPIGNPQDDSSVIIGMDAANEVLNERDDYSMLIARVKNKDNVEDVTKDVEKELRKIRDVEEGEEDFDVQSSGEIMDTYGNVLSIVTAFLIGIAAISLLVGGIGIMNTMYTATLQRTREIGTMKAIGASRGDILMLFLAEAGLLGLIGGAIGVTIGMGIGKTIEYAATEYGISFFSVSFSMTLIIGALVFSFFIGAVSGALPAYQASRLKPVEALRYE